MTTLEEAVKDAFASPITDSVAVAAALLVAMDEVNALTTQDPTLNEFITRLAVLVDEAEKLATS